MLSQASVCAQGRQARWRGACVAKGGHVWQRWHARQGGHAWLGGLCGKGGMHGEGGICGKWGHAWQRGACVAKGGMHGGWGGLCGQGVCMVEGVWQVACMARGCAWQGGCMAGGMHCRRDGHCSGWYTSYWNAFLCDIVLSSSLTKDADPLAPVMWPVMHAGKPTPSRPCRLTNTCENNTLPQLRLRAVKTNDFQNCSNFICVSTISPIFSSERRQIKICKPI